MTAAKPQPGLRYRLVHTAATLLTITATAAVAAPAQAATPRKCGFISDAAQYITARGTTCQVAKRVANAYIGASADRTPYDYKCTRRVKADKSSWTVTCRKSGKTIAWRGYPLL